jgi:hypothetical protein
VCVVQEWICQIGVETLQLFANSRLPEQKDAASRILRNLGTHPLNRTILYKSKLTMQTLNAYSDAIAKLDGKARTASKSSRSAGAAATAAGLCGLRVCECA